MPLSRRSLVGAGLGLAAANLLKPFPVRAAEPRFTSDPFTLGVASGFPEPTAVVLWTRLAPEPFAPGGGMPAAPVAVQWEIAGDEAFRQVARSGTAYATPDWAHSVHVEATGLAPGRDYWYRFTSGGARSPVGRTRTAPARDATPAELKLAVACCQHYEQGTYAAYRAMATEAHDVVVHLGDYIYEGRGTRAVRTHDAPEAITLEDYRLRYAIYKSDPHLKAAHAAFPWMLVGDDHEVANDYAGDHYQDFEPEWFHARRAAAYQAHYEHLPLPHRFLPVDGRQRHYTTRVFGNLVNLLMLDGRQYRSPQACGRGPLVSPCPELYAGERTMLGAAQEAWLADQLGASRARWNLIGQQTLLAHFDQSGPADPMYWADAWNGYPAARARLVETLATRNPANPVILSGDIHAFLVNDVNLRADDAGSPIVATEFVTTSISSNGRAQKDFDAWRPENPNVRLARSDYRGYLRLAVKPERLQADLVAVDDIRREDSPTHVLAAFEVEDGTAGVVR
ncbi:MAG TPA: alkaline phosphatase D family protein [Gammaproteobacteria bacterium]|jgi:alkaline phosphatase D|nr:alkaline phosphatase D family protein [Gammaproteobacteria bacterium]